MKKIIVIISVMLFTVVAFAFAKEEQKIMRERGSGLVLMNKLLSGHRFKMISNSAGSLAIETGKTGKNLTDPVAKELTLQISSLAREINTAGISKDGTAIKSRLFEIKNKCGECHLKFRKQR